MDIFYTCLTLLMATRLAFLQAPSCHFYVQERTDRSCGLFGWDECTSYRNVLRKYTCCSANEDDSHTLGVCGSDCPRGEDCIKCDDCSECNSGSNYPPQCPPKCFGEFDCPNGGNCERTDYCGDCNEGYGPPRCGPLCFGSTNCLHGGTCVRPNYCNNCNEGYAPPRCNPVCNLSCLNGGTCIAPNTCRCRTGYTTPRCRPVCNPSCLNGGTCIAPNQCSCRTGYTTPRCTPVCSPSCLNGGTCTAPDQCTCQAGYGAPRCEPVCDPPCLNGGTCLLPNYCTCRLGFFSPLCFLDVTVPQIDCPTDIAKPTSVSSAFVVWPQPIATDEHGSATVICTHQSGSYFNIGTHDVTCSASDVNGNTATCSFSVNVIDRKHPVLVNCPQSFSLFVEGVGDTVVADWTPPMATDNSGTVELSATNYPGQLLPPGVHNVTYTATDPTGLISSCTFKVTVNINEDECLVPDVNEECVSMGLACINKRDGYRCECAIGSYNSLNSHSCMEGINLLLTITVEAIFNRSSNALFIKDFSDPSSLQFLKHQERLQHLLSMVFGEMSGFETVFVTSFRSGSIVVDAVVTFGQSTLVSKDDVKNNVTNAIRTGGFLSNSEYSIVANEITVDEEICIDGFCQTGGTCVPSLVNMRTCTCPLGYTGERCESESEVPSTTDASGNPQPPEKSSIVLIVVISAGGVTVTVIVIALMVILARRIHRQKDNEGNIARKQRNKKKKKPQRKEVDQEMKGYETNIVCPASSTLDGYENTAQTNEYENTENIASSSASVYEDVGPAPWTSRWMIPWSSLVFKKKILAKGHFGQIRKGEVKLQDKVTKLAAITRLEENASILDTETFMEEFRAMSTIGQHANVASILGVCLKNAVWYVAWEYLPKGSIHSFLRNNRDNEMTALSPGNLIRFALDVAKGMQHIAACGVVHCELSSRNIVLNNDMVAMVSGIGLSKTADIYVKASDEVWNPCCCWALESLTNNTFTTMSDVWSFGVVVWEIKSLGRTPYANIESVDLASRLTSGYRLAKPRRCSDEIYNLMLRCWQEDPNKRPNFEQILEDLTAMNLMHK